LRLSARSLHDALPISRVAASVVGVLALAVYAATAYPYVAGGDSGELTVVSATLGVAHPPGYPLFTLLGHLFSYLPIGTVAYRVADRQSTRLNFSHVAT